MSGEDALCMVRFHKRQILELKEQLNELDPASEDLSKLTRLQDLLLERILTTEQHMDRDRTLRGKLRASLRTRQTKEVAQRLKARIRRCERRLEGYKFLLYLWRCFGDGIAFKYVSKWNMKRLLFRHDSSDIKEDAGRLGDKPGLDNERAVLTAAISDGIPAVLCDLTNTIRHGDVCLLGGSDPFPFEVKSSSNRNKRTKRQQAALRSIHSYLENDVGDISGFEGMRRVDLAVEERHHGELLNELADSAASGQTRWSEPEDGLRYIAVSADDSSSEMKDSFDGIDQPIVFMLNEAKTSRSWINYYPFTLSLRKPRTLYSFLSGQLYLIVLLDQALLQSKALANGIELQVVGTDDGGAEFKLWNDEWDGRLDGLVVSSHYVARLGLEFLSLDWFFEQEKYLIEQVLEEADRMRSPPTGGETT